MAGKTKKVDRRTPKNALTSWKMFNVPMFGRDRDGLLDLVSQTPKGKTVWIATVNPEFIMNAHKDRGFMNILQKRTSYNVADGVGLLWAKEVNDRCGGRGLGLVGNLFLRTLVGFVVGVEIIAGKHRELQISGADLIDGLCLEAAEKGKTVFFLGGWGDRGTRAAAYFKKKYPKLKVAGSYAGNRFGEDKKTLKVLEGVDIDYMFVAYAMKTQEEWINRNLDKLKVRLVMGVGRSFDYYSGDLRRAPGWVRKMGFEWLFSLIMEPKRWKRQLALPRFIGKVLVERW